MVIVLSVSFGIVLKSFFSFAGPEMHLFDHHKSVWAGLRLAVLEGNHENANEEKKPEATKILL